MVSRRADPSLTRSDELATPHAPSQTRQPQLGDEEKHTEELFMLYDAWERLNMKQLEYVELLNQALGLQVTIERLIEKK